jgi:hypothetical protein
VQTVLAHYQSHEVQMERRRHRNHLREALRPRNHGVEDPKNREENHMQSRHDHRPVAW